MGRPVLVGPHADDSWDGSRRLVRHGGGDRPSDRADPLGDDGHAAPRRRPWVFARQAATLDQLSEGRLDIGVGLGHDGWREFSSFSGEVVDPVERASFLDDSLEILRRFWSGKPVEFEGERIWVNSPPFLPTPVQDPLPVWVAARWPHQRPLTRAARNQGCFPLFDPGGRDLPGLPEPEQVAAVRTKLLDRGDRPTSTSFVAACRGLLTATIFLRSLQLSSKQA